MGERGQLIVTGRSVGFLLICENIMSPNQRAAFTLLILPVFEVIGVYPSSGQGQPETFCMVQVDDRQPARTKPVKVSDRHTNHRPGFEVKM